MPIGEDVGLKEAENILSTEILNWVRWARQRNYLPASIKCVLGTLYRPEIDDQASGDMKPLPPVEIDAEAFEKVLVSLPNKYRKAFVLHHLDKGVVGQITVRVKGRSAKAKVMGVGNRQYHYLLVKAHQLVLQRWSASRYMED